MATFSSEKAEKPTAAMLELDLAHSPDSDDAFMFYGLATRKVPSGHLRFKHRLEDIESLNQKALAGVYDVTAVSFFGYAYITEHYMLLPCGASFGDRYGPIVVSRTPLGPGGLKGKRIAVPGKMTTAFLTLQLYEPEIDPLFVPFDRILSTVAKGEAEAGVVIHEGQLTYAQEGLTKVVDLGEWWHQTTGLPLPLGGNAIKRSLGQEVISLAAKVLRDSIRYSLDHRDEALAYAMQFARGLNTATADQFVSMYVNNWTVDYGQRGREAVQTLLDKAHLKKLLPLPVKAEFASYPEGAAEEV